MGSGGSIGVKILIVTYSYAPDLTPRAFRWSALAAEFASMGHTVHVLCAASPGLRDTESPAVVRRVGDWLLSSPSRVVASAAPGKAPRASAADARSRPFRNRSTDP